MSVQCMCGRFMANAKPVVEVTGGGYAAGPYVADVIGDCKRCGDGVQAMSGYWHSWDFWSWSGEWE